MSTIYIKYKDHFYNILLNLRTISEHKHKRCLLIGSVAHTSSPTSMLIRSRSGRRAQREGRMHVEVSKFVWTTADAATVFLQTAYITACAFKPPPVTRSVRCVWVCTSPLTHSTLDGEKKAKNISPEACKPQRLFFSEAVNKSLFDISFNWTGSASPTCEEEIILHSTERERRS